MIRLLCCSYYFVLLVTSVTTASVKNSIIDVSY